MLKYKNFQIWFGEIQKKDKSSTQVALANSGIYRWFCKAFIENSRRRAEPFAALFQDKENKLWRLAVLVYYVPRTGGYCAITQAQREYKIIEEMPPAPSPFLVKLWVRCNFYWLVENYISHDFLRHMGMEI